VPGIPGVVLLAIVKKPSKISFNPARLFAAIGSLFGYHDPDAPPPEDEPPPKDPDEEDEEDLDFRGITTFSEYSCWQLRQE